MPRDSATANELAALINKLQAERQEHENAIAEIDATFEQFGITAGPGKKLRGQRRKGARPDRTAAGVIGKKKGRRKARGQFATTGNESILGFVKAAGKRGVTTSEIVKHWKSEGRAGDGYTSLGQLVRESKLKKEKLKGAKGSRYTMG